MGKDTPVVMHDLSLEPQTEALIACKINVGTPTRPEWASRTYHARLRLKSGDWSVAMGDGLAFEVFPSWHLVCSWFARLHPRDVEVLIQ